MDRPSGTYNVSYEQDMAIVRTRTQWVLSILGLVLLFCLPLFLGRQWLVMVNVAGISLVSVLGLGILTGYCGQISVGQAAFMGVGGYISAFLTAHLGLPFLVALPCAALGAGLVGILFGLPSLRIKGFYLAMSTLAAQFILLWCFGHIRPDILGGLDGIVVPRADLGGIALKTEQSQFYLIMTIAVLMTFLAKNLVRTRTGRAFIAIRDNDVAAELMGVNLFYYKLLASFICSIYAGVAGSLWVQYIRHVDPSHFTLLESIWYLATLIVGGMGSITGALFGTAFMRALNEAIAYFSPTLGAVFPNVAISVFASLSMIFFGLVIVLFLIFEPRGLAHRWEMFKSSYRLWPYPY